MKKLFWMTFFMHCFFGSAQLLEITDKITQNPAKLHTYIHFPKNKWQKNLPLVMVLHGCSQTAEEIYTDAGWEKLSDSLGFIVVLPEQRLVNNGGRCFNWFLKQNQSIEGQEIQSLIGIRKHIESTYTTDNNKTFIYGVSAGAVMAVNCIFLEPEAFQGAAILAGTPFGVINGFSGAFKALVKAKPLNDSTLIAAATQPAITSLKFPKTIVFQGDQDKIVSPTHAVNLANQIKAIRKLSVADTLKITEINPRYPAINVVYETTDGTIQLSMVTVHNWGHYLMVDPGDKPTQGGRLSTLSKDSDFWSTFFICKEWGF